LSDALSPAKDSHPIDPKAPGATASAPLPDEITRPLSRSWTEAEAFAYCTALTKSHYENFPVGSVLIPARLQPAIHSLYAFMRTADDFADENRKAGDEAERLAHLDAWGRLLSDCERGQANHPVFIALRRTLDEHRLPVQWLRDLLHAFTMDVTVYRYKTYEDVLNYCRYSANPVGRLILTLFGYRDEQRYRMSDAICTGLQLANHWQDVEVDLRKDRIYLPQEDLDRFGVTVEELKARRWNEPFRKLLAFEVERARELFRTGRPLPESVGGRLRLELRVTWSGGVKILDKIEAADYDVFRRRPTVTKPDWARIAVRSVLGLLPR
jgi:squalene synthase HpnC